MDGLENRHRYRVLRTNVGLESHCTDDTGTQRYEDCEAAGVSVTEVAETTKTPSGHTIRTRYGEGDLESDETHRLVELLHRDKLFRLVVAAHCGAAREWW